MSMWITARARAARSGRALRSAVVPSISGGQTKRIVRAGCGSFPSWTSLARVRATSRMAEQPLALSFAPGRWWSRWQERKTSCARSAPGITPVAMLYAPGCCPALTLPRSRTGFPAASRSCQPRAVFSDTMKAKVFGGGKVSRCPQRTRVSSSFHQAVSWFGA
jgi:hypothetical protein